MEGGGGCLRRETGEREEEKQEEEQPKGPDNHLQTSARSSPLSVRA